MKYFILVLVCWSLNLAASPTSGPAQPISTEAPSSCAKFQNENITITALSGNGLENELVENFELKLMGIVSKDFSSSDESIDVSYSCTDSRLVANYCIVNVSTEFGSYGAYMLEYILKEDEKSYINTVKKTILI